MFFEFSLALIVCAFFPYGMLKTCLLFLLFCLLYPKICSEISAKKRTRISKLDFLMLLISVVINLIPLMENYMWYPAPFWTTLFTACLLILMQALYYCTSIDLCIFPKSFVTNKIAVLKTVWMNFIACTIPLIFACFLKSISLEKSENPLMVGIAMACFAQACLLFAIHFYLEKPIRRSKFAK